MTNIGKKAVVFAYHNVGVRGLSVLLACGVDVALVVTHDDNPQENIWFGSVEQLARLNGIPVLKPQNPNTADIVEAVRQCAPDWLFSFYYRHMLCSDLLEIPRQGAFNVHGSLLPKYRGRVPVNWAVLQGETETGASLHRMVAKPDAGNLVDQEAVPILPNDTAYDVFQKVTVACEMLLLRAVPKMLAGQSTETPLDLQAGSYFGGRKPEDGRIDWQAPAQTIHNLIRAVASPYPGAYFDYQDSRLLILGSYFCGQAAINNQPRLYWQDGLFWADCIDGKRFCITHLECDGSMLEKTSFESRFGAFIPLAD